MVETKNTKKTGERTALESFFAPNSVAVIGATERPGSVGRTILANLSNGTFLGKVYPVNPLHSQVLDLPCFGSIGAVPEKVDLAIMVTPARTTPGLVRECVEAGVRSAIIISAGFRELGPKGAKLESEIQAELRRGDMRLVGPNCLGMMNPRLGLNATFAEHLAQPGNVAFLSQSGALLTAILDWSLQEEVGFSAIVSTGSMLDVNWGDLISFFGEDPQTQSILLYMESIGDARAFLSAAREVAFSKPIIVIKAGRSEAASHAASSHTGALAGNDAVFDAAFQRCGVLRVQNISDLFYMAEVLGKQPRPRGPRLMILTNAGGPGVLATDALIATGGELALLSNESMAALNKILPLHWSHNNPIDILGDADPKRFAGALEIVLKDPGSDGLLAILAPQGMTDPAHMAEKMRPYSKNSGKPVLASWMGGEAVAEGRAILNSAGIPTFDYPDTAARAFNYMWRYAYNLRGLYEAAACCDGFQYGREKVAEILSWAMASNRMLLTEVESKQVLSLYGIATVETRVARNEEEAIEFAEAIGFPVVLKVHSETVTHKTDVGGVKLDLQNREAVRQAFRAIRSAVMAAAGAQNFLGVTVQPMVRLDGYELILGSTVDAQFGPVILFGSGGQLVEVYRDRALALPPLNTTLAQRLMEQTRIFGALKGVRRRTPIDILKLEQLLVQFSQLVVEQPRIKEIDINPLLATPERLLALDARIVLHSPGIDDKDLPHPAIRPYPAQYMARWKMQNGEEVLIRPIRPEDEPLMVKFHQSLSDQSVYLRYFHMENLSARVAHDRLIRKCFIDYDREIALVAERLAQETGRHEIMAVGRLSKFNGAKKGEVAVLVSDLYQHQGVGTQLLRQLIDVGHHEGLREIIANILPENIAMRALANHFNFKVRDTAELGMIIAYLPID
ncbi:MAG TPA: bifunctional acetate--CoA ligase family protein/GNAT family N-acetyltransferase [Candidatus Acidoferrales bacterium]|nr:bifunctional acetate--CoA ligase family protein/GNAT family N-acetyltransferase [Candidatus Acidoferrales bacterium]